MKGIIWYYTNKQHGLKKLQSIAKEYTALNIGVHINTTSCNISLSCDNGDRWLVIRASENGRGQCCNIGLIEYGTPENLVREVLMPCIKAFPYRAYNYYS